MEEANCLTEFTKYPTSLCRNDFVFFVEFKEAPMTSIFKDHDINDFLVIILVIGLTNTMQSDLLFILKSFYYIVMLQRIQHSVLIA